MIPHEWVIERDWETARDWRCVVCKGRMRRHRGIIESDESYNTPPAGDVKGGCNIEKRIAHLEAELKMLREKLNAG